MIVTIHKNSSKIFGSIDVSKIRIGILMMVLTALKMHTVRIVAYMMSQILAIILMLMIMLIRVVIMMITFVSLFMMIVIVAISIKRDIDIDDNNGDDDAQAHAHEIFADNRDADFHNSDIDLGSKKRAFLQRISTI